MTHSGLFIKMTRVELNLSQKELALKIGMTGPQFLSNIERGTCLLPPPLIKKMAKYLKIHPSLLTSYIEEDIIEKFRKEVGWFI